MKEYADYASTEESDVNDEHELRTNQDADFEDIPEENSNFAMDFKEASSDVTNSGEQVQDNLPQEDISEQTNSQMHSSDSIFSIDDSQLVLSHIPFPLLLDFLLFMPHSIKSLPSFNLDSTAPVNLQKVQKQKSDLEGDV